MLSNKVIDYLNKQGVYSEKEDKAYKKALIDLGIEFPFEVSHEYCMVAELIPGATENVKGMVCYPTDFK